MATLIFNALLVGVDLWFHQYAVAITIALVMAILAVDTICDAIKGAKS